MNEDEESSSILLVSELDGILFRVTVLSSWCPRRSANPVLKSCTTNALSSQQTLTPQRSSLTRGSSSRSFM